MKNNQSKKNIPSDWQYVNLSDILSIGSGRDYKHLDTGDVPVFGTGGYMLSVSKPLHSGETVFIGRKGTIDKPFYFKGDFWTVDTLFYTHKFKNTTAKYINNVFQKIDWKSHNEASGVPSLSKTTIEKIKIPLPPIHEQNRIVSILETWDKTIEKLTQKIETKKQIKKALMQDLLIGKKRLSGFKDKWRTSEFNDLFEVLKKPNGLKSDNYQERGAHPIVDQSKDVLISGYTDDKSYLYSFNNKPVVVFGDHSRVIKYVDFDTSFGNDGIKIFQAKNNLNIRFGYYILSNFRVPETGYNRHFKYIEVGIFDIPSIKEQGEIEKILTTADKEITELEKKLSILKEQKRYLLNNLITGKIRTPETLSTKLTK